MATVLTIAGSDPVAGAGLQADIKAIEAMGMHACSVVTCVTSQNTQRVSSVFPVPSEEVLRQLESVMSDIDVAAVKTGMLYSADIVEAVSERIGDYEGPVVVDPVMAATSGGSLHSEGFVHELRRSLLPKARVVTPNIGEAERLTGVRVRDERTARKAADVILGDGADAVLVKGGHVKGDEAIDWLFHEAGTVTLKSPRVAGEFHGTGCVLASMIASRLASGDPLVDAVVMSKRLLFRAVVDAEKVGRGIPCVNPMAVLRAEAAKVEALDALQEAGARLEAVLDRRLLPEVGSNMGFAVPGGADLAEVAAFTGRIVRVGSRAKVIGCPRFGASKHVARIVTAASAVDPEIRCALNIKYSADNLRACKAAGFSAASFDRAKEPKGASSMTWGVTNVMRRRRSTPDMIFDRGGPGKEPMIRILGRSPEEVLGKLERVVAQLGEG